VVLGGEQLSIEYRDGAASINVPVSPGQMEIFDPVIRERVAEIVQQLLGDV